MVGLQFPKVLVAMSRKCVACPVTATDDRRRVVFDTSWSMAEFVSQLSVRFDNVPIAEVRIWSAVCLCNAPQRCLPPLRAPRRRSRTRTALKYATRVT